MGNLRSVEKALTRVGADVRIVSDEQSVLAADALVLPGVGAFGDCIRNLEKVGLVEAIRAFISSKRPFLGICLGFQALFESSEEAPGVKGLAIFPGTVPRFAANGLKVPHMGWNQLLVKETRLPASQRRGGWKLCLFRAQLLLRAERQLTHLRDDGIRRQILFHALV